MSNARVPGAQFLVDAHVAKVLWRLATPNVVAVAMMTAVTFADAWYVGQLGTAALASLALAFPFLTLMQMMAGGAIGGGTTSAVARAFGAGDIVRAESTGWHAVLIAIILSGLYTIVLGLFARPIFELLGGEGVALAGAVAYARIAFGGAAATWFVFVISAIHRGTGDTATPARAIATASVVQIVLSGALTLGWLGLPSLGVAGAAAAWVICQGSAAAYLAAHLFRGKGRLRLRPRALQWAPIRDIMKVGGLGLINSICMAMTVVVITGFVGRYGTEALAGYGLGARLELMLVPIAFGGGCCVDGGGWRQCGSPPIRASPPHCLGGCGRHSGVDGSPGNLRCRGARSLARSVYGGSQGLRIWRPIPCHRGTLLWRFRRGVRRCISPAREPVA